VAQAREPIHDEERSPPPAPRDVPRHRTANVDSRKKVSNHSRSPSRSRSRTSHRLARARETVGAVYPPRMLGVVVARSEVRADARCAAQIVVVVVAMVCILNVSDRRSRPDVGVRVDVCRVARASVRASLAT